MLCWNLILSTNSNYKVYFYFVCIVTYIYSLLSIVRVRRGWIRLIVTPRLILMTRTMPDHEHMLNYRKSSNPESKIQEKLSNILTPCQDIFPSCLPRPLRVCDLFYTCPIFKVVISDVRPVTFASSLPYPCRSRAHLFIYSATFDMFFEKPQAVET